MKKMRVNLINTDKSKKTDAASSVSSLDLGRTIKVMRAPLVKSQVSKVEMHNDQKKQAKILETLSGWLSVMEKQDFDYAQQVQFGEYQEEEGDESGEPVQKKAKEDESKPKSFFHFEG